MLWLLPGVILGCLALTVSASANEVLLQADPVQVTPDRPLELSFTVPAGWDRVYLALDGRLQNPDADWRGGSMPCARYWINDQPLTAGRLANVEDDTDCPTWSGAFISWIGESENWRLVYSPDFAPFVIDSNPAEFGDDPYRHVFDITDLVRRDGEDRLVIRHDMAHYPSFLLTFRDIRLLSSFERSTALSVPRDRPDTAGRRIVARPARAPAFEARLLPGGAVEVVVGGERHLITSRFSIPGGGFNRLLDEADDWRPRVSDERLEARCEQYSLDRTIRVMDERIEVRDRLHNLTDEILGVRFAHEVAVAKADLSATYMRGLRVPRMEGWTSVDVHPLENPTVYVVRDAGGIGLLPRDTVFRAQVQLGMRDGAYGLHNRYCALPPGARQEFRWDIYPTDTPDYYAFINAARRALNANYPIDGNLVIAHGFEGDMSERTDEDIRTLVQANNARYVVLSTISRLTEDGRRMPPSGLDGFAHGTGLMGEHGRWTRVWLERVIERFRAVAPDVKLLPYMDPWVCSEPGADGRYADSAALLPDGAPQLYTDSELFVFYPTLRNSYGAALQEAFDWLLEVADGFYMDESTMYHHVDAGGFAHNPDWWDGHTCLMDLGGEDEAGATYRVIQPITSSALYTLEYRLAQLRRARRIGKEVWMNFQPIAEEEVRLQSYRFVEAYSNSAAVHSHLGCPVSLANEHTERSETDIGHSVRQKLLFGGLYLTYGQKYRTDGNILQDLYPIEPVELHCGYVLGRRKIVTCAAGTYGFGDDAPLAVRIYDEAGLRVPERDFTVEPGAAETWATVELEEGELAIILKDDA